MEAKRVYFDCEVSPNIGFFWQPGYQVNIGYENIIKERQLICICYKFEGERQVYSLNAWKNERKALNDFLKVAKEAREVIGHNGDNFDIKWIRTRCLFHKIDMFPKYVSLDTLKEARKQFKFNSNRLDYIGKFIGVKGKTHTDFDMWRDIVLYNDKKALLKMIKYCENDVKLLEDVHQAMSPYIGHKSSITQDRGQCPNCLGGRLTRVYTRITAAGVKMVGLKCKDCNKIHSLPERVFEKARTGVSQTKLTNAT